jgi:hypothetical protein
MILLRLYPRAWRERYEAEMLALLEEHDVTLATRLDLLRGAFDAWHEQRRSVMAPLPTVARRAAFLGLIPSAFIIATFLLGLVLRSPFLVNYLGLGAPPAVVVVCLWAGIWAARGRRTWRDRLGAGLVAGVSAGLVAGALDVVVLIGLSMAQVVFGLWVSPLGAPSAVVAGHLQPVTVATRAANLLNLTMLLATVEGLFADAALGAAIGAIGAALRAILPGPASHPDQRPTAS